MNDQAEKNRREYDREVERIRADADLSDVAKRRMLREAHDGASRRHRELVEAGKAEAAENIARLERAVFAIPYPVDATGGAAKEGIRQSYRDAAFRVWGMAPDELGRVLERAEGTGNGQLARAAYHEATERGVRPVADAYLAAHPDERGRWERYAQARLESESVAGLPFGPTRANALAPARPAEVGG